MVVVEGEHMVNGVLLGLVEREFRQDGRNSRNGNEVVRPDNVRVTGPDGLDPRVVEDLLETLKLSEQSQKLVLFRASKIVSRIFAEPNDRTALEIRSDL